MLTERPASRQRCSGCYGKCPNKPAYQLRRPCNLDDAEEYRCEACLREMVAADFECVDVTDLATGERLVLK